MDLESLSCPSVCLSWLLDKIIGTEEVVAVRRKTESMRYYLLTDINKKVFYSGSRGEGLDFKSSDYDLMYIDRQVAVLNSIHDQESIDTRSDNVLLLMRREGCSPGFVILQLLIPTNRSNVKISENLVLYNNFLVLSSLLVRDSFVSLNPMREEYQQEAHGPCTSSHIRGNEFDFAHCFACNTWPSEAYSFIHRQRPYGWPSKALIDRIIQNGCHVVAIGDTHSDISHIQWRLSFSAAEKMLVYSFNHIQLKVYGLLKIFLKQAINMNNIVKDLLCSYFLKTALFNAIETTPQSSWREDRLIPCFWFCFNKLIEWVEQGYCPNYFVPQNNMFRSKVYGERRQALLCVLNRYRRQGWTCLYQCTDIKPLQLIVNHPQYADRLLPANDIEREILLDREFHRCRQLCLFVRQETDILQYLRYCFTLLRYARSRQEVDTANHTSCMTLSNIAQFHISGLTSGRQVSHNKNSYSVMKECERFLNVPAHTNIGGRYLTRATFYYTVGNYRKALHNCEQMILHYKPFVAYYGVKSVHVPDSYRRYVCGRNLSFKSKVVMATVYDIELKDSWISIYPRELHHDIQADPPYIFIPPLPYATLLMFLCHHQLGNIRSSLYAIQDLRMLVDDEHQGCREYPIVLNLLAICLHKAGDVYGAIDACLKSMKLKPNKNGASKILDKLLRG